MPTGNNDIDVLFEQNRKAIIKIEDAMTKIKSAIDEAVEKVQEFCAECELVINMERTKRHDWEAILRNRGIYSNNYRKLHGMHMKRKGHGR